VEGGLAEGLATARKRGDGAEAGKRRRIMPDTLEAKTGEEAVQLSPQQERVVRLVQSGRNVFFTGGAGTGKSETVKAIVRDATATKRATFVTALTGIAATPFKGGMTIHNFSGIGLGVDAKEEVAKKVCSMRNMRVKWEKCRDENGILIVDEVSMMSLKIFELLDHVGKKVLRSEEPFGGIQVVFCGDFFQLPPVCKGDRRGPDGQYCFESELWKDMFPLNGPGGPQQVVLTEVFRQREPLLIRALGEVRVAEMSHETIKLFSDRAKPLVLPEGIEATKLYSTNRDVDRINADRLAQLPGKSKFYPATDKCPPNLVEKLANMTLYPKQLELKTGAQVILLKNREGLANGSRGVVVAFEKNNPVVKFVNGRSELIEFDTVDKEIQGQNVSRTQLPLKLAWAITIHKAQGMSLDAVEVELSGIFEEGQGYVALSRARTLEGLRVVGFNPNNIRAAKRVKDFMAGLPQA
jgi:ATP-dependent DNA helicase PIF1